MYQKLYPILYDGSIMKHHIMSQEVYQKEGICGTGNINFYPVIGKHKSVSPLSCAVWF